jgi:DNA replication protein DnaC
VVAVVLDEVGLAEISSNNPLKVHIISKIYKQTQTNIFSYNFTFTLDGGTHDFSFKKIIGLFFPLHELKHVI